MKEDPIIRDGGEIAIDDLKNFKTIDNVFQNHSHLKNNKEKRLTNRQQKWPLI